MHAVAGSLRHLNACGKIGNSCIGFFPARKLTIKWYLSENLTFQNSVKNRKLLPAENFGNIHLY